MNDEDLEKLRSEVFQELDRVAKAQSELQQAYMKLSRLRLSAAQNAEAVHRAIDLVASW